MSSHPLIHAEVVVFPTRVKYLMDRHAVKTFSGHGFSFSQPGGVDLAVIFFVTVLLQMLTGIVKGAAASAAADTKRLPLSILLFK